MLEQQTEKETLLQVQTLTGPEKEILPESLFTPKANILNQWKWNTCLPSRHGLDLHPSQLSVFLHSSLEKQPLQCFLIGYLMTLFTNFVPPPKKSPAQVEASALKKMCECAVSVTQLETVKQL